MDVVFMNDCVLIFLIDQMKSTIGSRATFADYACMRENVKR